MKHNAQDCWVWGLCPFPSIPTFRNLNMFPHNSTFWHIMVCILFKVNRRFTLVSWFAYSSTLKMEEIFCSEDVRQRSTYYVATSLKIEVFVIPLWGPWTLNGSVSILKQEGQWTKSKNPLIPKSNRLFTRVDNKKFPHGFHLLFLQYPD
jgi:hypothetical protein